VLFWLGEAVSNRAVNSTQQNAESSRSHLILTLTLERGGRAAKLLLVDLAGSEKVKKTGERLWLLVAGLLLHRSAHACQHRHQARRAMCWMRRRASTAR
jgi:kinesin family protein 5